MRTDFQPDLSAVTALMFKATLGLLLGVCAGLAGYFIIIPVLKFYLAILLLIGGGYVLYYMMQAASNHSTWGGTEFEYRKRLAAQKLIRRIEDMD